MTAITPCSHRPARAMPISRIRWMSGLFTATLKWPGPKRPGQQPADRLGEG